MLHKRFFFFFYLMVIPFFIQAIPYNFKETIVWKNPQKIKITDSYSIQRICFENAVYSGFEVYGTFYKKYPIYSNDVDLEVKLKNSITTFATPEESAVLKNGNFTNNDFVAKANVSVSRKQPYATVSIIPVRWNEKLKRYEKLVSFEIVLEITDKPIYAANRRSYADHSVLSSGNWYKIKIDTTGIFKITYADLVSMGFDVNVNSANIAVFGNGGGILPEKNDEPRPDDLTQLPIVVVDGNDGKMNEGDYLLFYGEGPVIEKFNPITGKFYHQTNYYDDFSYYFITNLNEPALRIEEKQGSSNTPTVQVNDFTDYSWHELNQRNLLATGRTWYGEVFDFNLKQDFYFNFPNVIQQPDGYVKVNMASRAFSSNSVLISINDVLQKTFNLGITINNGYEFGKERSTDFVFTPKSDNIKITLEYRRVDPTSVAYLNYLDINVKRRLIFTGNQMIFNNYFNTSAIAKFNIQNADNNVTVWDISNPLHPEKVKTQNSGNGKTFTMDVEGLKKFIAFNGSGYYKTEFVEKVANQDLHAVKNIDYIIITNPAFKEEANRLADFHRTMDNMSVFVTTPQKIYNEFSSGSQDITAIRDFVKMVYDKSDAGKELKYLLLFGDASYDYKDRLSDNTNFVPCWESTKSLNIVTSVATDDYYGYMDDGEGANDTGDLVDIGIGRFPVSSLEQAQNAVDKCIHYATETASIMGPWRNEITFVADDEDSNHHLSDAETLTSAVESQYPVFNIHKIYVDAYEQISTPSGQRAPDVNKAINNKIEKGTLIFNYSGHGGEIGLGHEAFMQIADIKSWRNYDKLPLFITATCEFSRYDDPSRTSAGELVFLNSQGGAIALFTTARATYASSNLAINLNIYNNNLFKKTGGEYPCFGDVIRRAKVLGNDNDKKFVLLGDPALKMAYPDLIAKTVEINGNPVDDITPPDTLTALSTVNIKGIITDDDGNKQTDYNGTLYSIVFDKKTAVLTLGTDAGSSPTTFYFWKSVLFKGRAPIVNGDFSFEFIMPKDISYNYGFGRISYYFSNDTIDGHGYFENFIIGGFNENAVEDVNGPVINLFMNDVTFNPGDVTDENPEMLALVSDESGINTTGNGIGHDIIAKIDDDPNLTFNLNDYYVASEGDYKQGSITFPFKNLSDGDHTLSLKVWDIYNNSSIAELPFVVAPSEEFVISNLMNRPNPATDYTEFIFEHNQPGVDLNVEISVFQLNGLLIKKMNTVVNSAGYSSPPLRWNCTTDSNRKIGRGIYVYQLKATTPDGKTAVKRSKLVFIR